MDDARLGRSPADRFQTFLPGPDLEDVAVRVQVLKGRAPRFFEPLSEDHRKAYRVLHLIGATERAIRARAARSSQATAVCGSKRGRAPRLRTNTRRRGSRRATVARDDGSGSDDEPAGGRQFDLETAGA